jgi:lipopolysaccharide/colanic/teichoic acid biosynthesis glycosyltransferase
VSIDAVLIDREGGPDVTELRSANLHPLVGAVDGGYEIDLRPAPLVVGAPERSNAGRPLARAGKRLVDLAVAVPALALAAPLLLVLALAVRCTSRGPALFRQDRVGLGGRTFTLYKLRTMYVDAEERLVRDPELGDRYRRNGFKLPIDADPRITRIGRSLRRTSLDELPQLLNVVGGSMSLVGPRPVLEVELGALYGDRSRWYREVKPGMTGLWQVSGRSQVTHAARAELDVEYVETWTVAGDLALLVRTVPAVLRGVGAH